MKSILKKQFKQRITKEFRYNFNLENSSFYALKISARCQSGKQIKIRGGEDLKVEIDKPRFREIPSELRIQYKDIPLTWNGTQLKNLTKTVIFLLWLNQGEHYLNFIPNKGAFLEEIEIYQIENIQNIEFNFEEQSENGNCRPWFAFVLVDLPLKVIRADVTTKWRLGDSDDVKLIIDSQIKKNNLSILHRNWLWSANIFKKLFQKERQTKISQENLPKGIHYLELWADRMPILHKVELDLGGIEFKRIPTVDDPKWTGDLNKDTEQMILARAIWGEARNQSWEARVAVGWSIRNRVKDKRWGDTYHEVILEPKQYSAFWEQAPNDNNLKALRDPLGTATNLNEHKKWWETYEIAGQIIDGGVEDYSEGATFYHDVSISEQEFFRRINLTLTFIKLIGGLRFYK